LPAFGNLAPDRRGSFSNRRAKNRYENPSPWRDTENSAMQTISSPGWASSIGLIEAVLYPKLSPP
jgi:hypothetical protein